jgi:predicted ATPase
MILGDQDEAVEIAEQTQAQIKGSADDEKSAYCKFVLGWAQAEQGDYVNGILLMKEGLDERPPDAFQYYYSHCLSMLANVCFRDARIEQGMHYLHQALEEVNLSSELWWEAELHRLEGHARLLTNGGDLDGARSSFQKALQVAQSQDSKMLELRAATSLARLLQDQDARREALDLLTPVYEWFTEGFESDDLREAKILIDELS